MIEIIANLNELNKVVEVMRNKKIILLKGDLASGKTTLVKEFVKSLGISETVTSPTFSIQQIYDNRVYHYDIYNKKLQNFLELGLFEELEKDGFHLIEWADEDFEKILSEYGFNYLKIEIKKVENKRRYEIGEYIAN